ncbi:hypothetical protein H4S08_000992 [Coemansia sp. RSA 1365]|nr:hypothetical protein H4S08_000992 [Coemansia sp. RSA 1365]
MAPHNCTVSSHRMTASSMTNTGSSGNVNSVSHNRPATSSLRNNNNNSGKRQKQQQKPQRGLSTNPVKDPQQRQQSVGRGKPGPNQRKSEDGARPKAKRSGRRQKKIVLLTRDASDGEQQSLLARLAPDPPPPSSSRRGAAGGNPSPGTGKRGRQTSPVVEEVHNNQRMHTPTPKQQQQQTAQSVLYSPTPRRAGSGPMRGGSPGGSARSNHYAGASFNNSPAPNTLPLPPSFLTTPTKSTPRREALVMRDEDVFGMPGGTEYSMHHPPPGLVAPALDERTRHLQSMLDPATHAMLRPPPVMQQPYSHSAVDLSHQHPQDSDMESMFQKLRLAMDLAQKRPATVNPVTSVPTNNNSHLTPVHNA